MSAVVPIDSKKPDLLAEGWVRLRDQVGDPRPVLEQLRAGATITAIAEGLGITKQSVSEFLLRHCGDEWRAISAARNLDRLDVAAEALSGEKALSKTEVSQHREAARVAMWQLERLWPAIYAPPKLDTGTGVTLQVVVNRNGATEGLVIDAEAA